ncbi:uncharacterized protein Dana_GF20234 [Drosophila ananassae]|uniref:Uncharacterized protein n=1 Tax=Drosophila ananassae TaxID=7217 RepID=B3MQJ4_DROAN|nr:uncharacterized protein LOC6502945 [Drosophila ananassae]EDV44620.2 uncharacterized protein Dana_GF20234 [Drosophila ananassae]
MSSAGGGDHQEHQKPEDSTNCIGDVLRERRASSRKSTSGRRSVRFRQMPLPAPMPLPPRMTLGTLFSSPPGLPALEGEVDTQEVLRSDPRLRNSSRTEKNIFAGRHVTCASTAIPFRMSKFYVQPKLDPKLSPRSLAEGVVRTICGVHELTNVLLVITPTSSPLTEDSLHRYKMHIYRLDNQRHLCTTALTHQERDLIELYHDGDNYSILHCSRSIQMEDAARNTPIRAQIFETVRDGSPAVRRTWYKGHPMSLALRFKNRLRIGVHTTHNPFGIRSLREPKIPVRMTRFTCLEAKEEPMTPDKLEAAIKELTTKKYGIKPPKVQEMRLKKFQKPSMLGLNKIYSQDLPTFEAPESPIHFSPQPETPRRKDTEKAQSRSRRIVRGRADDISLDPALELIPIPFDSDGFSSDEGHRLKKTIRFADLLEGHSQQHKAVQTQKSRRLVGPVVGEMTEEEAKHYLAPDRNGVKMLWRPQDIRESEGCIPVPSLIPTLSEESIIHKSSMSFAQQMGAVAAPSSFSPEARAHLEQKLHKLNVRQAFRKFGILVERINQDIQPQSELLLTFFQFAEILDFKMFVRRECTFAGRGGESEEPRYVVECYVFEDCREFVAAIGVLCRQLHQFAVLCPGAARNLYFVDDAFDLTRLPKKLTGWLKTVLCAVHARGLYDLLGELTLELVHPPATLLDLTRDDKDKEQDPPRGQK